MKSIVIIDNKINNEINIQNLLGKFNNDIKWIVKKFVPSDFNETNPNILFIHINNKNAVTFIKDYCEMFQNIYITSTSPSTEQLRKIQNCDKVKLFDFPILNEITWKSLDWSSAISRWKNGEDFPINYLKPKGKTHLISLSILCQGYLAAHGGKDLNGWEDSMIGLLVSDAKEKTEKQGWWQPAFEKKNGEKEIKQSDNFSQAIISDEISSINKTCENSSAIEALFTKIKRLNDQSFCDTNTVINAYKCISRELL